VFPLLDRVAHVEPRTVGPRADLGARALGGRDATSQILEARFHRGVASGASFQIRGVSGDRLVPFRHGLHDRRAASDADGLSGRGRRDARLGSRRSARGFRAARRDLRLGLGRANGSRLTRWRPRFVPFGGLHFGFDARLHDSRDFAGRDRGRLDRPARLGTGARGRAAG
jgi:hypothetical protein